MRIYVSPALSHAEEKTIYFLKILFLFTLQKYNFKFFFTIARKIVDVLYSNRFRNYDKKLIYFMFKLVLFFEKKWSNRGWSRDLLPKTRHSSVIMFDVFMTRSV